MPNPILIQSGTQIGSISAEADDDFLFSCFLDHPALSEIRDISSSKMLLLGGTGSGKTAILRKIGREEDNSTSVEVHEMAMNYISNSDVIQFLNSIDVKLDLFFQSLWKHVICIEFIRLRYSISDSGKSSTIFNQLADHFRRDNSKKKAIEYLRNWEDKFWISMDENIVEITNRLEKGIEAELGSEISKFRGSAGYSRTLGKEKKTQLQQRAKKFVEGSLLSDLAHVVNLLSNTQQAKSSQYYILIDKIDEHWVDESIRYNLVRSLIETLKGLRKIRNVKVIVAIRNDLLEKVIRETGGEGFQSEKYEDYILRLRWTNGQLKKLVNDRINYLYRRKYTKSNVFFEDIFTSKIHGNEPFTYMISRTLQRPRDMINFVNFSLSASEGNAQVSQASLLAAERNYSSNRRRAIEDEWRSVFPAISIFIESLYGLKESFTLSEVCTKERFSKLVEAFMLREKSQLDPIWESVKLAYNTDTPYQIQQIVRHMMYVLNISGVVGIKIHPNEPYSWFSKSQKSVEPGLIEPNSKIKIHPMLYIALGIRNLRR